MGKMATLSDQTRYSLSCSQRNAGRISVLHVKLPDTAVRALESYQELVLHQRNASSLQQTVQVKGSLGKTLPLQPSIHFKGSQGCIKIPSTDFSSDAIYNFDFFMSNVGKDHPQGSFDCLQQAPSSSGASHLALIATVENKLTVCATDDSCQMTQERVTQDTHRTNVIKPGGRYKGKQVPVRKPAPLSPEVVPERKRSTPINPAKTIRKCLSQNAVSQRPFRDRIIHLLALRSCKKLEVVARLQRDGIHQKDRKSLGTTLQQVANLNPRENSYTLKEFLYREIQRDWPGYSEAEKSQIDRILARKLGIPSRSCKDGDTSSSQVTQKRQRDFEFVNPLAPKKARISHLTNQEPNGSSPQSCKNKNSGSAKRLSLPYSVTPGSSTSRPISSHPPTSSNSNSPSTPDGCGIQDLPGDQGFFFSPISSDGATKAFSPCPSLRSCTSPSSPTVGTSSVPIPTHKKSKKKSKKHKEKDQEREKGKWGDHDSKSSFKQAEPAEERPRHKKGKRLDQESRSSPRRAEQAKESGEVFTITDLGQDDRRGADNFPAWKDQKMEKGKWTNQGNGHCPRQAEKNEERREPVVITDTDKACKMEKGKRIDQSSRGYPRQAEQAEGRHSRKKGKRVDKGSRTSPWQEELAEGKPRCSTEESGRSSPRQAEQADGRPRRCAEESGRSSPRQAEQAEGRSRSKKGKQMDRGSKSSPRQAEQADGRPRRSAEEGSEVAMITDSSQDSSDQERSGQSSEAHSLTLLPDYVRKYVPLVSMNQRQSYKQDYNAEYDEYRHLRAIVGNISAHFNELAEQCSMFKQGTEEYEKFCGVMRREYTKVTQEHPNYQVQKQRYLYLHEKLSHIKQLISDFDKRRA